MADRLRLLLQAAPVLSPSGSFSSSSSSSTACYKEGGCISDYVAVALTALVSLMSVSSPHPPYRHHIGFFPSVCSCSPLPVELFQMGLQNYSSLICN